MYGTAHFLFKIFLYFQNLLPAVYSSWMYSVADGHVYEAFLPALLHTVAVSIYQMTLREAGRTKLQLSLRSPVISFSQIVL